jgi:hypothetical protein
VPGLGKTILDKGTQISMVPAGIFPNISMLYPWAHIITFQSRSSFIDFEEKGDFIYSRFNCKKSGMEDEIVTMRSRVLIGADGVHSAVSKRSKKKFLKQFQIFPKSFWTSLLKPLLSIYIMDPF